MDKIFSQIGRSREKSDEQTFFLLGYPKNFET